MMTLVGVHRTARAAVSAGLITGVQHESEACHHLKICLPDANAASSKMLHALNGKETAWDYLTAAGSIVKINVSTSDVLLHLMQILREVKRSIRPR